MIRKNVENRLIWEWQVRQLKYESPIETGAA